MTPPFEELEFIVLIVDVLEYSRKTTIGIRFSFFLAMSARKYLDVVDGRPGKASLSIRSDMNSWMRTFQQENEDEALKIVVDMSKVRSFKQLHCFLYLR